MIDIGRHVAVQFIEDRIQDDAREGVGPFGACEDSSVREDGVRTPTVPPRDPWGQVEKKVKGKDVERVTRIAGQADEIADVHTVVELFSVPEEAKCPSTRKNVDLFVEAPHQGNLQG